MNEEYDRLFHMGYGQSSHNHLQVGGMVAEDAVKFALAAHQIPPSDGEALVAEQFLNQFIQTYIGRADAQVFGAESGTMANKRAMAKAYSLLPQELQKDPSKVTAFVPENSHYSLTVKAPQEGLRLPNENVVIVKVKNDGTLDLNDLDSKMTMSLES